MVSPTSGESERAARIVLDKGVKDLVVVHSPLIALAVAHGKPTVFKRSVNIPSAEVLSANGAGDAFAAGMMYGVHEGVGSEALLGIGTCQCCLLAAQPCNDWVNRTVVGLSRSCKSMGLAKLSSADVDRYRTLS